MPNLEESMEHFGITEKEIREIPHIYHASNCDFYREKMGIDWMLKDIKHTRKQEKRKVRIIIDYDADFPAIVSRVIFRPGSQSCIYKKTKRTGGKHEKRRAHDKI